MYHKIIVQRGDKTMNVTVKEFKNVQNQKAYVVDNVPYGPFDVAEISYKSVKIKQVGRNYVTLDDQWNSKFAEYNGQYLIETGDTEWMSRKLFPTKDAVKEYLTRTSLENWFNHLQGDQLSLDQLWLIKAILEPEPIDTTSQLIEIIDGTADIVSELMMLLTKVPGDYDV